MISVAKKTTRLLLAAGVLTVLGGGVALAQESGSGASPLGFGIRPAQGFEGDPTSFSYFTHYLSAGTQVSDQALVENTGDQPIQLRLYPAAASTAVNGGTAFANHPAKSGESGAWITLDQSELLLAPGQSVIVDFTIDVPADASAGDHVGGLIAEVVPLRRVGG